MLIEIANQPPAEGIRLWEAPEDGINIFDQVGQRYQVPPLKSTDMIWASIEIKAWEFNQLDSRVQFRVGRTRNNLDGMTGLRERETQVTKIDPLTTAVRVAAITQQTNFNVSRDPAWTS